MKNQDSRLRRVAEETKFNIQTRRKSRMYVDTGFKGDVEGRTKALAWKECPECFGRGVIGEAIMKARKMFSRGKLKTVTAEKAAQPCRCIRTTELNIGWIVL